MEIMPGQIRYLGARGTLVRKINGSTVPGFALIFSLANGEVHEATVEREGFTEAIGREAIIAAAKPFLELAAMFPES